MRYFSILAQIFHLSLPKIWQAHSNINYFFEKYMERKIIPKSFKALAVILKLWLTGVWTFGHFQSFFSKIWLKTPLRKSVGMETWQDLDH